MPHCTETNNAWKCDSIIQEWYNFIGKEWARSTKGPGFQRHF